MTDRELDRMMQHVLLDAIKRDCEKETDDVPAFKPDAPLSAANSGRCYQIR